MLAQEAVIWYRSRNFKIGLLGEVWSDMKRLYLEINFRLLLCRIVVDS